MAKPTSPKNSNLLDLYPLVKTDNTGAVQKVISPQSQSGLDYSIGHGAVASDVEGATFTPGTTAGETGLFLFDDAAIGTATEDKLTPARVSSKRVMLVHIADPTTTTQRAAVSAAGVISVSSAAVQVDDAAFTPATGSVSVAGGMADETGTDSVDEGDAGALRMTLNRRLITAGQFLDDAAYAPAADYTTVIGAQADETATDSVDEGDAGALRMTLDRRLIDAGHFKDDAALTLATTYANVMGALADETSPDSVDEGDAGFLRMTLARNLHVVNVADAATLSTVASQDTNITILAANANRIGATIFNNDTGILYLKFGATATATTSNTVAIAAGGYYELPAPVYRGIIDGIWTTSGSGSANVTELT